MIQRTKPSKLSQETWSLFKKFVNGRNKRENLRKLIKIVDLKFDPTRTFTAIKGNCINILGEEIRQSTSTSSGEIIINSTKEETKKYENIFNSLCALIMQKYCDATNDIKTRTILRSDVDKVITGETKIDPKIENIVRKIITKAESLSDMEIYTEDEVSDAARTLRLGGRFLSGLRK